jgi:hypothetical protein
MLAGTISLTPECWPVKDRASNFQAAFRLGQYFQQRETGK